MTDDTARFEAHLILPVGTQIVTRRAILNAKGERLCPRGAVGVIIALPQGDDQNYHIRMVNEVEVSLHRSTFAVRKRDRRDALQAPSKPPDLYPYVMYRCIVGSRAFGLDHDESDTDRRGFYVAPPDLVWSLNGAPEQLENEARQETYWELQKFLMLALKANPNVLECLYTPLVETAAPLAQELLSIRSIFLSKYIYQTYNGYVLSQFKKLEQDLRTTGEPRWKHAMHLIRLLISGITVLREGFVMVRVDQYRDSLLAIRRKQMLWDEVNAWRLRLHKDFDQAFGASSLPEKPDFERANAFLIKARRSML